MRHVVNFSGGVCSFWAAKRVIDREGPQNVTLLFADVLIEDADLYRFNAEAEKILGVPITRISLEMTPWELFARQRMIGSSRVPLCSVYLKREPLDAWQRKHLLEMDSVIYVGIDWTELHRLEALRSAKRGWRIEAPMTEPPLWDKCKMLSELKPLGIEPPRLYRFGLPHNNCGGLCVKAGISHFVHVLKTLPDKFADWEWQEEKLRASLGDFSILHDRRGGGRHTLSLKSLRERVQAGERFPKFEWGGCGCGVQEADGLSVRPPSF